VDPRDQVPPLLGRRTPAAWVTRRWQDLVASEALPRPIWW